MLATLNVHEAMGHKVDREAVALMLLPQLWQMSVGPCTLLSSHNRSSQGLTGSRSAQC